MARWSGRHTQVLRIFQYSHQLIQIIRRSRKTNAYIYVSGLLGGALGEMDYSGLKLTRPEGVCSRTVSLRGASAFSLGWGGWDSILASETGGEKFPIEMRSRCLSFPVSPSLPSHRLFLSYS